MNKTMTKPTPKSPPASIDATLALLGAADYLADRSLATVLFLALKMGRPLFLEGEAGVGKTEIAKVLSGTLGRRLIRLQCYEGLDVAAAVYEWNYAAQMIAIRVAEAQGDLGGVAAQAWLYPVLTNTRTESGVPAGVSGATVVHKTGAIDMVDNDAALVISGPAGPYVLVVMTDGLGGSDGWQLIAGISSAVWQFETSRAQ